jgi:serine/threonine protein kinase
MQASAIDNGTIMQGEYTLLDPIGSSGHLFRARSRRDGRLVMVRLWRGANVTPERVLEKPQVAGRVQHPMLAALEACGRESDGTWYMISELVEGMPLTEWADQVGIPPLGSVIDFMHRICQGLGAAHREGLSHDALHPGNVRVFQPETSAKHRMSGKILEIGVPAFMVPWPPSVHAAQFLAPEQLTANLRIDGAALNADARMNVYSCGSLLYYLCTGGAPFPSRTLDELTHAHGEGRLIPPSKINPQVPPTLETVILRALSLQRSERYVNVGELGTALSRVRVLPNTSGIRPRVEGGSQPPAKRDSAGPQAKASAFDERPTSESRISADWMVKAMAAPPPPSGDSLPPALEDSNFTTMRPPTAARDGAGSPAGSFSSAPPVPSKSAPPDVVSAAAAHAFSSAPPLRAGSAAPQRQTGSGAARVPVPPARGGSVPAREGSITDAPDSDASIPPSAPASARSSPAGLFARALSSVPPLRMPRSMPPPPDARDSGSWRGPGARRAPPIPAVVKPLPFDVDSLAQPEDKSALPVLVAEHDEHHPGTYLAGLYHDHPPTARRSSSSRLHPVLIGAASIALLGGLGFWFLRKPPVSPQPVSSGIVEPLPPPSVPTVTRPRLKPLETPKPEPPVEAARPASSAPAIAAPMPQEPEPSAATAIAADIEERTQRSAARPRAHRPTRVQARRGIAGRRAETEAVEATSEGEPEAAAPVGGAAPALAAAAEPTDKVEETVRAPAKERAESGSPAREAQGEVSAPPRQAEPSPAAPAKPEPAVPLRAQAAVQGVTVRGSLATSVVARAVERIRSQFVACYARAATAAGRNGFSEVIVEVQLDERGRATSPRATGGALPGLAACVADAAGKVATDRPPDTGVVKAGWKVVFAP